MIANITRYLSNTILEAKKVLKQPTILRKQKFELSKIEKKNQIDIRARYISKKSRPKEEKEIRKAKKLRKIKKIEMPVFSFIRLLILHLYLHLNKLYLAASFTYTYFNYKLDLDTYNTKFRYILYILAFYLLLSF